MSPTFAIGYPRLEHPSRRAVGHASQPCLALPSPKLFLRGELQPSQSSVRIHWGATAVNRELGLHVAVGSRWCGMSRRSPSHQPGANPARRRRCVLRPRSQCDGKRPEPVGSDPEQGQTGVSLAASNRRSALLTSRPAPTTESSRHPRATHLRHVCHPREP